MLTYMLFIVTALGAGIYFVYYKSQKKDIEDVYLWVGHGKNPFKK